MKKSEQSMFPGIPPENVVTQTSSPVSPEHEAALKEAIQDAKKVREKALENAKEALEEAFSNSKKDSNGNILLQATGKVDSVSNIKGYEETKKILTNFHSRMERYAKYLSKEGSAILCIAIANSKESPVFTLLNQLPSEDQETIKEMVEGSKCTLNGSIYVEMDEYRDFKFRTSSNAAETPYYLFNTTIHPKPTNMASEVPVKNEGETISIGGKINLNKKDVQKMCGIDNNLDTLASELNDATTTDYNNHQKKSVSGRNAYEIRADILDMSLGFHAKNPNAKEDDIIKTAQKFYSFVEQKRIR